jgi:hypothetical protein
MLGLRQADEETKKCQYCTRWLLLDAFGINPKSGLPYFRCSECRPKHAANQAVYLNSYKGKATVQQYEQSDTGKANQKRKRTSEKGKARSKRGNAKRLKRRQENSAMRLAHSIKNAALELLSKQRKTSPAFLKHTAFNSEEEFVKHMKAECRKKGHDFNNRDAWTIDRKIPEEAYNFDDPRDVLRCWLPHNITALTPLENKQKLWHLIDHWIASAGPECYPLSWKNRPPTEEMKKDHHDRMLAPKPVGEEEEEFEACEGQGAGSSAEHAAMRTEVATASGLEEADCKKTQQITNVSV